MLRFLFLLLTCSVLLLWPSAGARAQDNGNDNDDYDYEAFDDYIDEVLEAADAFWRGQAQRLGFRYTTPDVRSVAWDERVRSDCGRSRGVEHSYCSSESRIYLDYDSDDPESLWSLWVEDNLFVVVTVVGHEWGHHIQNLLGIDDGSVASATVELQADCLMGVFGRAYQLATDWVSDEDIWDAIISTTISGHDEGTLPDEMTHGMADQRLEAFLRGYRANDVKVCGI